MTFGSWKVASGRFVPCAGRSLIVLSAPILGLVTNEVISWRNYRLAQTSRLRNIRSD